MVNLFWAIATSYIVLGIVGAVLIAAIIVGYFPLLKWFPVLGEYVPIGKLVSLLAMGLLCGLLATRMTAERYDAAQAAAKVIILQGRLDTLEKVNKVDAAQAAKNADEIARLRHLAGKTPSNNKIAIPEDSAERIGVIR